MSKKTAFLSLGAAVLLVVLAAAGYRYYAGRSGKAAEQSSYPASQEGIRQALAQVYDWELDTNIIDLGLVREVTLDPSRHAGVTIIFTSPFCPYEGVMIAQIRKAVLAIDGIDAVKVRIDRSVRWSPDLMSEAARERLKDIFR